MTATDAVSLPTESSSACAGGIYGIPINAQACAVSFSIITAAAMSSCCHNKQFVFYANDCNIYCESDKPLAILSDCLSTYLAIHNSSMGGVLCNRNGDAFTGKSAGERLGPKGIWSALVVAWAVASVALRAT